jgi:hypothetical protein
VAAKNIAVTVSTENASELTEHARAMWHVVGVRTLAIAVVLLAGCSKKSEDAPTPTPKHEDRNEPAIAPSALTVAVVIDGKDAVWQRDSFDAVPHFQSHNDHGGDARDTWSLRELAHKLVGPTARVTAIAGNKQQAIDAAAWDDAERTPILHTTRRGTFKFRWADKDGTWGDAVVNDVTRIEIAR